MNDVSSTAEKVRHSEWFDRLIRVGLIAYGIVHLMLGWLALQLAFGEKARNASSDGALRALAQQPLGKILIWVVAIGMFILVLWRLLQATLGYAEVSDDQKRLRKRAAAALKAVLYGAIGWSALQIALGSGSSGGGGGKTMTAKVMDMTGGQLIVGAVGLAVIGYGVSLIVRGWTEKFKDNLDAEGQAGSDGSAYITLGKVGYIAKGVAITLVGGLFVYGAITHDAKRTGGLDQALQKVLQYPFGQAVLVAIALGIIAYGLFCFARAKHLDR